MTDTRMNHADLEPLQVADMTPDQIEHLGVLTGRAGRSLLDDEGFVMTDELAAELRAVEADARRPVSVSGARIAP